ncbi:uncharacterized protein LOC114467337 isoform X1 [Gouania willdenowi]|uniref:uncharacterized protein LOC114467337 isoform X1 n=1 Tax=Gouania willdenowi TaxID=441366 RepID=UPI001054BF0B|nr:uncharacterized protein LOC114467337 isoform X1 [Gouania willdenowi]
MTRQCSAPGCRNGSGLHQFPSNPELRLQWLRALGITDHDLVSRAAVCNEHFSPECFSNLTEVKMGFSKVLHLRSGAVPTKVAPPPARVTSQSGSLRLIMPKPTMEIKKEPVSTEDASAQTDFEDNFTPLNIEDVFSSRNNPDADTKPPESQDALLFLIKTEDDDTKHPIKSGPSDESNDEQGVGVAMSEDNTSASEAEATASPQGVSARPSSSSRRRRRKRTNETTAAFMELQKRHHEDFMEAEKERQRQELDMFSDWMREQRDMEERRQQEAHLMFQQLLSFLQRPSQATPPEQPQTEKHNY